MTENELVELVKQVLNMKCETQNIELKTAKQGCPENLYDTLSSFSNTKGGIIIFGIDEKNGQKVVGVDNPQEMKKALDLPENEEVVMMLDLGYGNQKEPLPNHHLKKELAETVKYL